MKNIEFEVSRAISDEIAECIVDCCLDRNEAREYAWAVILEHASKTINQETNCE